MPVFGSDESSESVKTVARRAFLRRCAYHLVLLAAAGLVLFGAFRGYRAWQKHHLSAQAQRFFDRADYRSAVLVSRRLLLLDENNIAAFRIMAETAKRAGKPEAVSWFQRLSEAEPNSKNLYALAFAALQFGQLDYCEHLLGKFSPDERNTFRAHSLAGGIAIAKKQPATAEREFAAALALQPGDVRTQLNLAAIRITSPDEAVRSVAEEDLVRLARNQEAGLEALRTLAADALTRRKNPEHWTQQLIARKDAAFSDYLLNLQARRGTEQLAPAVEDAKKMAASSPATTSDLITWMNRNDLADDARNWAATLPSQLTATQPVPLAMAESYSFLQDWEGLKHFVEHKNWQEFEGLRLAVASHAARRISRSEQQTMEAATLWRAALKKGANHPEQIAVMAELAAGWGYRDLTEEALWTLARGNHDPKGALANLQRIYKEARDTHGLLRVARRAYELNPGDLVAANNCASLGLLVTGDSSARRLAARLHHENPRNAAFATTYAFALHIEGKTTDGLKVLRGLKEEFLRIPAIAAYHFVLLVENGENDRARGLLDLAKKAHLLPEEQKLVTAATRKLIEAEQREKPQTASNY